MSTPVPIWSTSEHIMVLPIEKADQSVDSHPFFRLIILSQGKLLAELEGEAMELTAPSVLCLHDRRRFVCRRLVHCDGCVLFFDPSFLNRSFTNETLRHPDFSTLAEKHSFFQLQPFLKENPDENRMAVSEEILHQLMRCARFCSYEIQNRGDWYWSCRTRSYFMDIIRMIENIHYQYGLQTPEQQDQRQQRLERGELQAILEYIEAHIEEALTLETVCLQFRTYKKQVERWFRSYKGTTYYQYVKDLRLKKVCFYLRFTELQMKEIAVRVGFSSAQNLAKFFQKEKRCSMSEFRRQSVRERKNDIELQSIRQGSTA